MTNQTTPDPPNDDTTFLTTLQAHLLRWDCPTADMLGDYHLGMLAEEDHSTIQTHLEICHHCREEVSILQSFLGEEDTIPAKKQPAIYYPTYAYQNSSTTSAQLRGESSDLQRFTFQMAGDETTLTLFLGLIQSEAGYNLNGQFSVDEPIQEMLEDAQVEIWQREALVQTVVDDLGTFFCTLKDTSPFTLRITTAGNEILFGRIMLA